MKIPKHLGVIMDGNRRYAKRQGLPGWKGHYDGAEVLKKFLDWSREFGIKECTFYTFSTENFGRPKKEVDEIMKLFRKFFGEFRFDGRIKKYKVKIRFVGRLHMFPEDVQQMMHEFMDETKKHSNYVLNFAMGYGGRAEIVDMVSDIVEEAATGTLSAKEITEELIQERLWITNDIDMVIRTGDASRTSNFFPWQTSYAEWFFLKKTWPEMKKTDLNKCLVEFSEREVRRGK